MNLKYGSKRMMGAAIAGPGIRRSFRVWPSSTGRRRPKIRMKMKLKLRGRLRRGRRPIKFWTNTFRHWAGLTDFQKVPVEIFAKAPGQRTTIAHTRLGDATTAYDGRAGWIEGPDKPVPVLAVPAGEDLDGIKLDGDLSFPGRIKQALGRWRVDFPESAIDDHEVGVVQGTTAGGSR